jgi:hypothetical protein
VLPVCLLLLVVAHNDLFSSDFNFVVVVMVIDVIGGCVHDRKDLLIDTCPVPFSGSLLSNIKDGRMSRNGRMCRLERFLLLLH